MSDTLPNPEHFLATPQIHELQAQLGLITEAVRREITAAQEKIAAVKREIADRWKSMSNVSAADRNRIASQETSARVQTITQETLEKLDDKLKQAAAIYGQIDNARAYYPNKMNMLMTMTATEASFQKRNAYAASMRLAGPVELVGYAAFAAGTQNKEMAAAAIQVNDSLPSKDRRFLSLELANKLKMPAWDSVQAAFKLADVQHQEVQIDVRAFRSGRANPVAKIGLALQKMDE